MTEPKHPKTVTVSRADLLTLLSRADKSGEFGSDGRMALLRLQASAEHVAHETPAGGGNGCGITIEDNQDPDCFSIRSDDHDGGDDLIHFCDWPALKAAIDKHQSERGGRI